MQAALPITIGADEKFSDSLKPLLHKLEMWINFQALKSNWYGNEDCTLCFEFTLIRALAEKTPLLSHDDWIIESGYAYYYDPSTLKTTAFIAVADLVQAGVAIEQAIKNRLTTITNKIALQHDLHPLS